MRGVASLPRAAYGGLLLAVVAGCSGGSTTSTPRNGGTLTVALAAEPASLNPLAATDPVSRRAYSPLFPLLFSANADLSVGPELAASLPSVSDHGTTLTVTLRGDAKWSDGQPITADDVVFTVQTERDPALPAHAGYDWGQLKAVKKVDATTVRFSLAAADAAFVADSLVTPIVPAHAFAGMPPAQIALAPFGSAPTVSGGPFTYKSRATGKSISFDANPSYVLGRPHVDHLVESIIGDSSKALDGLENGTLSWVPLLSPQAASSAASAPGVMVSAYPATSLTAVVFNVRPGHPFAGRDTRRAFAYSLAHDSLVAEATASAQDYAVWGDVNPASWAFDEHAAIQYAQDGGKARALLGGAAPQAMLIYPSSDSARAAAASSIARQAAGANLQIAASPLDDSAFGRALGDGSFDLALVTFAEPLDPDNAALFGSGGAENYGGYANPALDALLAAERGTSSTAQSADQARKPIFSKIEQLVTSELPLYFLWVPRAFTGWSATVAGVAGSGAQLDLGRADSFYRDWYIQ